MANLLEHYKCPVCFEVPEGKVFQCKNGHTFCSQCNTRLKICPQCRSILGTDRIRNRTLEELLDVVDFNCPNKELGCGKIVRRHEISAHLQYCKFEPFYFCKLIGFQNCPYNAIHSLKSQESSELLAHLREAHPEIIGNDIGATGSVHLTYENIISKTSDDDLEKGTNSIWTPHLVSYTGSQEEQNAELLFLCQTSEVTRNVAWICLSMTDYCPGVVEYKISGRGLNDKDDLLAPEVTWKAPVMPFKDIEKELESFALRISFCVLNSLQEGRGSDLQMSIKFGEQNAVRVQDAEEVGFTVKELTTFTTKSAFSTHYLQRKRLSCSNILPSTSEDDEEEDLVFLNVYCNDCGRRPLTKMRYKCLQCIDYDLCRRCMDRGDVHSHHVFARIQNSRQNDYFNWKHRTRLLKGKSSYI